MCQKCVATEHAQAEHRCVAVSEVERTNSEEIQVLVTQARTKLEKNQEYTQALETDLSELQEQYDNAKGLINETFQSYKSLLEQLKVCRALQHAAASSTMPFSL